MMVKKCQAEQGRRGRRRRGPTLCYGSHRSIHQLAEVKKWRLAFQKYQQKVVPPPQRVVFSILTSPRLTQSAPGGQRGRRADVRE